MAFQAIFGVERLKKKFRSQIFLVMKIHGGRIKRVVPGFFFSERDGRMAVWGAISRNEDSAVPYGVRLSYYAHLTGKLPMRLYFCLVPITELAPTEGLKIVYLARNLFLSGPCRIKNKFKRSLTPAVRL